MKKVTLAKLKPGTKGKVSGIEGSSALSQRLMSMGIYPGKDVTKVSHFALKGAVTIKVGRVVIALGHRMAEKIVIEIHD